MLYKAMFTEFHMHTVISLNVKTNLCPEVTKDYPKSSANGVRGWWTELQGRFILTLSLFKLCVSVCCLF
jgi:hypothetical protein